MPFARALIVVRCRRFSKKSGETSDEVRHYISSELPGSRSSEQWDLLVRGHWGGVEIRNHWRRDAIMGEDRSRTRNPSQIANLSLLRNAVIAVIAARSPGANAAELRESLQQSSRNCFAMATQPI